jgi:UDP-glucose 4-epimerase
VIVYRYYYSTFLLLIHLNNKINVKIKIRRKYSDSSLFASSLQLQHKLRWSPQIIVGSKCQNEFQWGRNQEVAIKYAD